MDLFDRISKWPKYVTYPLGGLVFLGFVALVWAMSGLGEKKAVAQDEINLNVIQDAETEDYNKTRFQEYAEGTYSSSVDDYWNSLADDGFGTVEQPAATDDYLDPAVYSEMDRYYITHKLKTVQEVDAEHARKAAEEEAFRQRMAGAGAAAPQQPRLSQAQQDSLYFARIEQAYAIAAKYSAPQQQGEEPVEEEEEEKHIDIGSQGGVPEPSSIPMDAFGGDGIISSLGEPAANGIVHYAGTYRSVPVKATFLKTERLVSGQKVIVRLMQDMTLSDGTMIPANTHITGICSIGRRLKINVTMLQYNGRMFPVDISVYDNDGTEGIYCPMAEEISGKGRKAKKVAGDIASGAAGIVGTAFTGNILLGSAARSSVQQVTSSLNSDGTVAVNVSAGCEFYVFENIKER